MYTFLQVEIWTNKIVNATVLSLQCLLNVKFKYLETCPSHKCTFSLGSKIRHVHLTKVELNSQCYCMFYWRDYFTCEKNFLENTKSNLCIPIDLISILEYWNWTFYQVFTNIFKISILWHYLSYHAIFTRLSFFFFLLCANHPDWNLVLKYRRQALLVDISAFLPF